MEIALKVCWCLLFAVALPGMNHQQLVSTSALAMPTSDQLQADCRVNMTGINFADVTRSRDVRKRIRFKSPLCQMGIPLGSRVTELTNYTDSDILVMLHLECVPPVGYTSTFEGCLFYFYGSGRGDLWKTIALLPGNTSYTWTVRYAERFSGYAEHLFTVNNDASQSRYLDWQVRSLPLAYDSSMDARQSLPRETLYLKSCKALNCLTKWCMIGECCVSKELVLKPRLVSVSYIYPVTSPSCPSAGVEVSYERSHAREYLGGKSSLQMQLAFIPPVPAEASLNTLVAYYPGKEVNLLPIKFDSPNVQPATNGTLYVRVILQLNESQVVVDGFPKQARVDVDLYSVLLGDGQCSGRKAFEKADGHFRLCINIPEQHATDVAWSWSCVGSEYFRTRTLQYSCDHNCEPRDRVQTCLGLNDTKPYCHNTDPGQPPISCRVEPSSEEPSSEESSSGNRQMEAMLIAISFAALVLLAVIFLVWYKLTRPIEKVSYKHFSRELNGHTWPFTVVCAPKQLKRTRQFIDDHDEFVLDVFRQFCPVIETVFVVPTSGLWDELNEMDAIHVRDDDTLDHKLVYTAMSARRQAPGLKSVILVLQFDGDGVEDEVAQAQCAKLFPQGKAVFVEVTRLFAEGARSDQYWESLCQDFQDVQYAEDYILEETMTHIVTEIKIPDAERGSSRLAAIHVVHCSREMYPRHGEHCADAARKLATRFTSGNDYQHQHCEAEMQPVRAFELLYIVLTEELIKLLKSCGLLGSKHHPGMVRTAVYRLLANNPSHSNLSHCMMATSFVGFDDGTHPLSLPAIQDDEYLPYVETVNRRGGGGGDDDDGDGDVAAVDFDDSTESQLDCLRHCCQHLVPPGHAILTADGTVQMVTSL